MKSALENILQKNSPGFCAVVDFDPAIDKFFRFDFSGTNAELSSTDIEDTTIFSAYISQTLKGHGAKFGIGGYNEDRVLYKKSSLFDGKEPRTVHLGIDIWGAAGTKIYVPVGGTVHSFAYNNHPGDYGATIILQHQLDTLVFYTLYGHLSLADIAHLKEGKFISRGEVLAHFGEPSENGDWPPHLHFQLIEDIRLNKGDYPGVCTVSERMKYLANCPDPDLVLNMMKKINEN